MMQKSVTTILPTKEGPQIGCSTEEKVDSKRLVLWGCRVTFPKTTCMSTSKNMIPLRSWNASLLLTLEKSKEKRSSHCWYILETRIFFMKSRTLK